MNQMRYPPAILDEIRARLPVSQVVGRRVRLIKAGREFKGLSPFNAEKSPSFFVNDQKGFYHCFSSGQHGDIFRFLMETEGVSFPEAVERLAAEAGVTLPKLTREAQEQVRQQLGLAEACELAAQFFEASLRGPAGRRARDYLAGRDLGPEVQARFRLGYAPAERFALRDHLAARGVPAEVMIEAGLLIAGDDIAVPFDRFRDRVMFPICDTRGKVIAFGGRALEKDVPAKYLNSPETPLFHKGRLLYNHHVARPAAHDRGRLVAVEGYVDAISMAVAGFPETVAPLGTALTEDQLALMWRMVDEPILCFDGDAAGTRAAFRAVDVALPHLKPGKSLRFAFLPGGQDPDDLIRRAGAAAMESVLAVAQPLVDVLWRREAEAGPTGTPEQRAAFEARLRMLVARIADSLVRGQYESEIGARLRGAFGRGGERTGRRPASGFRPGERRGARGERGMPPRRGERLEGQTAGASLRRSRVFTAAHAGFQREALIALISQAHPDLLARHAEDLGGLDFADATARDFMAALLDRIANGRAIGLDQAGDGRLAAAAATLRRGLTPADMAHLHETADIWAAEAVLNQAIALHRRAAALHTELDAAERAFAEDPSDANFAWLSDVRNRLNAADGIEAGAAGASRV
jgi:DNA primase